MTHPIYFDDALPLFVKVLVAHLSPDEITAGVVVRDMIGRLSFTAAHQIEEDVLDRLNVALIASVGRYVRPHRAAVSGVFDDAKASVLDDLAALRVRRASILDDPATLRVRVGDCHVRLIDRRLSGGDWLRAPRVASGGPPIIVFASMKGGVGRSTALVVSALDLVSAGRRVLAIDLDIEAPGLGVMLLSEDGLPSFGVVDALMERKLGPLDDGLLIDLVAPSRLGGGLLVCPALGARSMARPAEVLSKIGRLYGEAEGPDGGTMTILDQLAELVQQLGRVHNPDVILIDARAGLHEITAATILGFGSEVLLFGLDEPQTWHAYRVLLAQLSAAARDTTWADALTPVQGKAPVEHARREAFKQRWQSLLVAAIAPAAPVAAPTETLPGDQYVWDADPDAPVDVREDVGLAVLYNSNFSGFDPLGISRDRMDANVIRATFGNLLDHIRPLAGVTVDVA